MFTSETNIPSESTVTTERGAIQISKMFYERGILRTKLEEYMKKNLPNSPLKCGKGSGAAKKGELATFEEIDGLTKTLYLLEEKVKVVEGKMQLILSQSQNMSALLKNFLFVVLIIVVYEYCTSLIVSHVTQVLIGLCLSSLAVYWGFGSELLKRRVLVYVVAVRVIGFYTFLKYWEDLFPPTDAEESEAYWSECHSFYSSVVCKEVIYLRGFWVKVGQYLSSRADVMPKEWGTGTFKAAGLRPC